MSANAETANSDADTESIEEEIEPRFQYQRIAKYMQDILNKDAITCCAVHPKFLIFGTFLGSIYLLDHQGNSVDSNLNISDAEFVHSAAVNHVDVDPKGEYLATCSDDGKVNITGLFSDESNQNLCFERSIKAVALDSDIKSTAGKRFIVGDDKLTMYERNFFKKLKTTVLSAAENAVLSICWNGNFVAWASHLGVRVYDLNDKCSLGLMKWEEPFNARLEYFRCNFRWSNANTLLIGWVDTIRICVIRKRNSIEAASRFLPGLIVDPVSTFQTTFYICGLAPLTGNQLVVLGYPKEKDENHKALRPVLCVVEYKMNSSEEIYTDSLLLRGYQEYTVNDYNLGCLIEENRYYIVAPKDIVVASLCDTDYRVNWLVNHCKFEEALEVISERGGKIPIITVAKYYINYLLAQEKFDAAAKTCLSYLGNNKSLWEEEVFNFVKYQQLRSLRAYLPTTEDCTLDPQVYEMVLYEYLKFDVSGFLDLIKVWPHRLYDCAAVINAIRDNFQKAHANELLEALAILYSHKQDYESALRMYLRLQNKDVFDLIQRHTLYAVIDKLIIPLIDLDRERAFRILLDGNKMQPDIVVQQLEQNQEYLYLYLDALDKHDRCSAFHWKLVNLYAKHDRSKLLPFLRRSNNYPIQEALDVCKRELFYPEMVYLLERMGSKDEALNIIMHKMNDFEKAVEFCKQHNDNDLWDVLIKESIEKPELIIKLLYSIEDYVDPVSIVHKIKLGQIVPGLRKGIWKMLMDYRLQTQIRQTCKNIQTQMMFRKHAQLVRQQNRALSLNKDIRCAECDELIIRTMNVQQPQREENAETNDSLILFYCGHYYHRHCLSSENEANNSSKTCELCKIDGETLWDVDFDFLKTSATES